MRKRTCVFALVFALVTAYAVAQEPTSGTGTQPGTPPAATQDTQPDQGRYGEDQDRDRQNRGREQGRAEDQQLHQQLHERFNQDPAFRNVQISVDDGRVTLEGAVASKEDRKRAKELARQVSGVRNVRERLRVDASLASSARTDTGAQVGTTGGQSGTMGAQGDLRSRIESKLRSDPSLSASNVMVNVNNNNQVVLSGTVRSEEEKRKAEELARSVAINQTVVNNISVSSAAVGAGTGTTGGVAGATTGATTQQDTSANTAGSIAGSTTQGTTSQTGVSSQECVCPTATSPSSAGTQPQSGTMGGATTSASGDIRSRIQSRLQQEGLAQPSNVLVNVNNNNQVVLSGTVRSEEEKRRAEQAARSVAVNQTVINNITVSSAATGAATGTTGGVAGTATGTTPQTGTSTTTGTTGGVAGTTSQTGASTQTGTTTGTTGSVSGSTAPSGGVSGGVATETSGLESQIETALRNEPTLVIANVDVVVRGDLISLSGSVPDGKAKQTAKRIAQSYAGNRRVEDRLTVSGRGAAKPGQPDSQQQSQPEQQEQNPNEPRSNPQTQGDASGEPR
jgi:osmotically-inducible protein OsmY